MIQFVRGNLLDAEVEALVNTVNTVGIMGKGIALQFKRAFPANYRAYRLACQHGEVVVGRVFAFDRGPLSQPQWIFNFATKGHWRSRSRIEDIEHGLEDLRRLLVELGVQSVAVPPLGCGHGGLAWDAVGPRIEEALGNLDLRVLVFEPGFTPQAESMSVAGPVPRLTRFRAALLSLLASYRLNGYSTSLLEAQKLAYLLQSAGEDLKLEFKPHLYGPYSHRLNHALEGLEGHYLRGLGDQQSPRAVFDLLPAAEQKAARVLAQQEGELKERINRVTQLVAGFETPYGLELLASIHWLAHYGLKGRIGPTKSPEETGSALQRWNPRKASLFDSYHVQVAWEQLSQQGWLVESN